MTVTLTAAEPTAVHPQFLDCIQSNLAVLADTFAPGRHLALGAELTFRPRSTPSGLPTVEPVLSEQLRSAAGRLGLEALEVHHSVPAARLREIADRAGRVYVVADAFDMPWLPYYGKRHMDHSFLIEPAGEAAIVVDAYDNQTAWGPSVPGRWRFHWTELPVADLVAVYGTVAGYRPPPPAADFGPHRDYLAAYAEHRDRVAALEQLAVETWLLTRARHLHAAYRRSREGAPSAPIEAQLQQWDRVAATAFIALRRVQRAKPEPATLLPDLGAALEADRTVFAVAGREPGTDSGRLGPDAESDPASATADAPAEE